MGEFTYRREGKSWCGMDALSGRIRSSNQINFELDSG